MNWLGRHTDRPVFAFVNYFDAHGPYNPPAPFDSIFDARSRRLNPDLHSTTEWTGDEIAAQQRAYEASIAYLDQMLGQLFAGLRERGLLENTIIVVTADHGEEFHEHGVMEHGNSLYRNAVHVPLLVVWPGHLLAGAVVPAPVSLREVAHTLAATAAPEAVNPFPGRPLTRFLQPGGGTSDTILIAVSYASGLPESYPVSSGPLRSAVRDSLRFIVDSAGREELYDQRRDPDERHNLVADPAAAAVLTELRSQAAASPPVRMAHEGAPRRAGRP
jgi:arylsulfatase A-like enzyme